jgi:hypothetical protein
MAARKAPSRPAEPTLVAKHRQRRKPGGAPTTAVNYRKTAKDVIQLIDCLTEMTQDLQAARKSAPELPTSNSRSGARARRVVPSVSLARFCPRGNPLTQSMEFTDPSGAVWLAYIEGAVAPAAPERGSTTVLPGRHLRFDSAGESRYTSQLPAGSPFLAEARLQSLLEASVPEPPLEPTTGSPARARFGLGVRAIHVSTQAIQSGREAIADWSRRWKQRGSRMGALRRYALEVRSGAAHTMHGTVEMLLGHRTARP